MSVLTLHFDANNRLKVQSIVGESKTIHYTVCPNFTDTGTFLTRVTWQNEDCSLYIVYDTDEQADKPSNREFFYFTWEALESLPKTEALEYFDGAVENRI